MKKNIIVYGIIAGIVVSSVMLFTVNYISHCEGSVDYSTSMLIVMLATLVLLFVAWALFRLALPILIERLGA